MNADYRDSRPVRIRRAIISYRRRKEERSTMEIRRDFLVFLVYSLFSPLCLAYIVDPGPKIKATEGEVWPKPQIENKTDRYYIIEVPYFHFNVVNEYCSILQEAKHRYTEIISAEKNRAHRLSGFVKKTPLMQSGKFVRFLTTLDVNLTQPCTGKEIPGPDMVENYTLTLSTSVMQRPVLEASTIWGILRGLETFTQCLYRLRADSHLYINATKIIDYPRFRHRGILLDTSRHYLGLEIIYRNIDAMVYNKMNVFHWHIVDDQSFPYQSRAFPELSNKGAYHPEYQIYTIDQVSTLIEYARMRGIRVIAEFDTPGHTRSWGEGMPELLTACYADNKSTGQYGPMNPARNFVFDFLDNFFNEIKGIFLDGFVHLGGDEVSFECWESNRDITDFMTLWEIEGNYTALQQYFMKRLLNITASKGMTPIVWEEVYNTGTPMPKQTLVQVWQKPVSALLNITSDGYRALYSSCWYLDHIKDSWQTFYECDPQDFNGTAAQLELIWGGEACMWGEMVDDYNALPRIWPRASAVAEKLWSGYNADVIEGGADRRLEEHSCRMNKRGIPSQPPNGPGTCIT